MKKVKRAQVVLRLVCESVQFAIISLKANRFRTLLSLLGVSIGVFSILIALSVVEGLKRNIQNGLNTLSPNTIIIQRESWEIDPNGEWDWWKYMKRAPITKKEYNYLKESVDDGANMTFFTTSTSNISSHREQFNGANVVYVEHLFEKLFFIPLEQGRWFASNEIDQGGQLCCLGWGIAEALFKGQSPIGEKIRLGGKDIVVCGTISKQGESLTHIFDIDNSIFIPMELGERIDKTTYGGIIAILPSKGGEPSLLISNIRAAMRSVRGLDPSEEDDFAINKMTYLSSAVDELFHTINLVALFIGGFSLLIGGFSIANILFVSVQERMPQIGIQKGLGAKNYVILTQFLTESALLSVVGGLIGILIVLFISLTLGSNSSIPFRFTIWIGFIGIAISLIVGLSSGIIPAYYAAKIEPVKAMNL